MKSKTIILSEINSHDPRAGRGILTLSCDNSTLTAKLRLYNIDALAVNTKLGVYYQNQVYSTSLANKGGYYEGKIINNFNMNDDFYCAVLDTNKNNQVIVAGGTYAGCYFDDNSIFEDEQSTSNPQIDEETTKIDNLNNSETFDCDKCAHCRYKEFFYSQNPENEKNEQENSSNSIKDLNDDKQNLSSPIKIQEEKADNDFDKNLKTDDETNKTIKENNAKSIINSIIPQFDYIFNNYPLDEDLNKLIENGKFVKINESDEQYSIGAIYENEKIKYICYAVRKNYNDPIPNELGKFHQWLPLDVDDPLSEGYHIVFQDANDLKIIEV